MDSNLLIAAIATSHDTIEEDDCFINYYVERRYLRNRYCVMDLDDKKFTQSFRVNKEIFKFLIDEIKPYVGAEVRITKIPLDIKLAAVLNFYATGSYQRSIGDILFHSMDQSVISRAINEITKILEKTICAKYIKFPNDAEKLLNKQRFFEKTSHPGIIGCIDCTHIDMIAPKVNEHIFVDRKGNHSLNVQLICNYDLLILSVNATYPGSSHDSAIWALSQDREVMKHNHDNGERNTWLLGDSGYPLEPWLMTPYRNPTPRQEAYNYLHAKARNPVERCNGVLKNSFRCLLGERVLRYVPLKVIKIVNVCCALFNMCLLNKIELAPYISQNSEDVIENDFEFDSDADSTAVQIRNGLLNSF